MADLFGFFIVPALFFAVAIITTIFQLRKGFPKWRIALNVGLILLILVVYELPILKTLLRLVLGK
jgi:hypothetical protein